jgi:WD repeat-containing protein 61
MLNNEHNFNIFFGNLQYLHRNSREESLSHRWDLEGHQLGVISVDINQAGTSKRTIVQCSVLLVLKSLVSVAASSSLDSFIRLWDLESGKQFKSIEGGAGKINVQV